MLGWVFGFTRNGVFAQKLGIQKTQSEVCRRYALVVAVLECSNLPHWLSSSDRWFQAE